MHCFCEQYMTCTMACDEVTHCMIQKPGFFFDAQTCTGCGKCVRACAEGNHLPLGIEWRHLGEYAVGLAASQLADTFAQNVVSAFISMACNHCEEPLCIKACPTGAMHRTAEGVVQIDASLCSGCRSCEQHCPYGAPQYNVQDGTMTKCNFCYSRLRRGEAPFCVEACPTQSLGYGEYDVMIQVYGCLPRVTVPASPMLTRPRLMIRAVKFPEE